MPEDERGVLTWIRNLCSMIENEPITCCLEQVTGFIHGKEDKQPGSSMFVFGQGYGALRMALIACRFYEKERACYTPPFLDSLHPRVFLCVPPRAWQSGLGIEPRIHKGKDKECDGRWKRRLCEEAQKRFPRLHITRATADALLIAHYCKLTYGLYSQETAPCQ